VWPLNGPKPNSKPQCLPSRQVSPMQSDREIIATIKDRINLVELVGRNVKLRKSGMREWVGCCPFHGERTPSFNVIPDKNLLHCFGCGWNGDAFAYVMQTEGLTFPEALEQLAGMAGVELPKRDRIVDSGRDAHLARLHAVLEEAQGFFAAQLLAEEDGMCYLQGRGLKSEFIAKAGLGVAPPMWDMLTKHLRSQGFKDKEIEDAGVAAVGQRGNLIDSLRGRITIPIRDYRGKLVAFGGRTLGEDKPKYLNTRETDLFHKGETLFGLHEAKAALQDGALVVEGYFDVLTLQMLGLGYAVAPLGTALTEAHLDRLGRYTKRITLCFDGDEAGHRAMDKTLSLALPKGFDVRLLELPTGHDPDTWALNVGVEAFRELVRRAPDWTSFKISRAIKNRDMRKTPERMAVLIELAPLLGYVAPQGRDTLMATLAHQLQLPASEVARAAQGGAPVSQIGDQTSVDSKVGPRPAPQVDPAIQALVVAWQDDNTRQRVLDTPRAWWQTLRGADLLEDVLEGEAVSSGAQWLLRDCEAKSACGLAPNLDRLLIALELTFIESELRQLRQGMEDPQTAKDLLAGYEKAQLALLTRRSHLNRRHGRIENSR